MKRKKASKLIPKEYIAEEWMDDDGYWIALQGLVCAANDPQCHQIHENTKAEAHAIGIMECPCRECNWIRSTKDE